MAVKIRLARRGRKKLARYDVVVTDARAPRDGRFIEKIGTYNPLTNPATIELNDDKAFAWLMNGAQPSDTVRRILAKTGVWAHWRAVQQGQAEIGAMTDRRAGTVERKRPPRASKKAAAKIGKSEGGAE